MGKYGKFAVLMAVIVGSLIWLAAAGMGSAQTYYKTISEVKQMGPSATQRRIRVGGDVVANSIVRGSGVVTFTISQESQTMKVAYEGRDPLPDTFRDGAQALAGGKLGADGVFHASEIQAKCASKYAPKPGMAPDQLQPKSTGMPARSSGL